jgi:uncharacterized protein (DUF427 family)
MPNPIKILPTQGTWTVRAAGAIIGESTQALELTEGDHPAVIYFPRSDIAMAFLDASEHSSYCPHKGTALYFSIEAKSGTIPDAAWSYQEPNDSVTQIKDHIAFFASDKVTIERI